MSLLDRAFVLALGLAGVLLGRFHWRSADRRAEQATAARGRARLGYGALSWRIAGAVTTAVGLGFLVLGVWPSP